MPVQIQALNSSHDCKGFDCGTPSLNQWLATLAGQQQKKNIARTFVLVDQAAPETVLGFYALAVSEVDGSSLPDARKWPRRVPVVRLGRFATQQSWQGRGIGQLLLFNALERIAGIALNAGIAAIAVDAKDEHVAGFYRKYGFVASPERPLLLFLPMATLEAAIEGMAGDKVL